MQKIRLSISNILQILALLVGLWLMYLIRDILILIFVSIIIASAFRPWVDMLQAYRIRRTVSGIGIYILFFGVLGWILYATVPPVVNQTTVFLAASPELLESAIQQLPVDRFYSSAQINQLSEQIPGTLVSQFQNVSSSVLQIGLTAVEVLLSAITVLILSFYLLIEYDTVREFVTKFFPDRKKAGDIFDQVERKLGVWLRGQFAVMVIVGLITYLMLLMFGVEFALPLAVLAGVLEILPFVGPTVASIPALLIAVTDSPARALGLAAAYFVIQQLESSVVVPKVMKQTVGLNPIVVIIAVMIGARLAGPAGALLAVPAVAVLVIAYDEWQKVHEEHKQTALELGSK